MRPHSTSLPSSADRRQFRKRLLAWYRRHGRDLPWRKTDDPYHILVSEIMLQQTQVDRVLPKYAEWLSKYPSLHALAGAPEHEVTKTWYPLGYNIRPRRLHSIAREAVANSRYQRRSGSVQGVRRRWRRKESRDETPPVARFRGARAEAPGLRFQPGADGFWRSGMHRAQSQVSGLPHVAQLSVVSTG
jgi:hypothetical protein